MSDLPIADLFAPLAWIFLVLLAANLLLFVVLVLHRENWSFFQRRRARIRARLAPLVERLVRGDDPGAPSRSFAL
jgi:hypothetical protein